MNELPACPKCKCEYTYASDNLIICPECFYEWEQSEEPGEIDYSVKVVDANGNQLQTGDNVVIVKDLPVKGAPKSIKSGTKVKNIRIVDSNDGHNIDCKIDGFGAIALKSEFVRKA